jgi:hypothetical protein
MLLAFVAFCVSNKMIAEERHSALMRSLVVGGMWTLAAFAGGLWTNLLFRNTSAAFWFSLLVPLGLVLLAGNLVSLIVILGVYSVAGFLWARILFLRVQDTQWTGGIVSFPSRAETTSAGAESITRKRRPLRALFKKEIHSHPIEI